MERTLRFGGKLSTKILEGMVEGVIQGGLNCIGPKGLDIMISRNWFILESLFYAMRYKPDYPEELSREEIMRAEGARAGMVKTVLPLLGMAKTVASKLPSSLIEENLDGGWLMRRAKEKFPVLAEGVQAHGAQGEKWLEKQAKEFRLFLMGKLRWDDRRRKLVRFRKVVKKT